MADRKWFADHLTGDAHDRRPDLGVHHDRAVGPEGARHPRPRSPTTTSRTPASRSCTCRTIELGSVAVLASRISYVGELGWELYVPMEQGAAAVGAAARGGQARRRGAGRHRRLRHHRPHREGLPRVRVRARRRAHDRRGGHAAARRSRTPTSSAARRTSRSATTAPQTVLCTLTVDDHTSAGGVQALHARRRADPHPRRRRRSPTATATTRTSPRPGRRPSLGKHVLHGLPAAGRGGGGQPSSPCPTWRSCTR